MRTAWNGNENGIAGDQMLQAAAASFTMMARSIEPIAAATARAQSEMVRLVSQRAQAYLTIPQRLGACRTPQDVVSEQMRFWQVAAEQYGAAWRGAMGAWSAALPQAAAPTAALQPAVAFPLFDPRTMQAWVVPFWGIANARPDAASPAPERDYISVSEPKPDAQERGTRRAA